MLKIYKEALKLALQNPPTSVDNPNLKKSAAEVKKQVKKKLELMFKIVLRAITSHKNSQIQASVDQLSHEELDILMKYIYKGFSLNQDSNTCARYSMINKQNLHFKPSSMAR